MVGGDTDKLYTLHPWTGAATAVGSATAFGVSETEPRGLAALNGTLYMVGAANDALYTLNTATGVAMQVGSATQFGVSEGEPTGISAHGGVLYMTGADTDALYTLDTSTGAATQVGSAAQFGASEGAPGGLAWHRGTLYMVSNNTDRLYWINSTTGVATAIGSATEFGVMEGAPTGIVSHASTADARSELYMVGSDTDKLWTVDTATGEAEAAAQPANFGLGNLAVADLASHGGQLYMVALEGSIDGPPPPSSLLSNPSLYSLDPLTGLATAIGKTGASFYEDLSALASHGGTLYALGATDERLGLLSLNTATGAAARVGSATAFGTDERFPWGLASHNGVLYMTGGNVNDARLYTVGPETGIATAVGNAILADFFEAGGLVSHNGTLYAYSHRDIYTVDTATGVATRIRRISGSGVIHGWASQDSMLYAAVSHDGGLDLHTLDPATGALTKVDTGPRQFGVSEGDPQGLASGP